MQKKPGTAIFPYVKKLAGLTTLLLLGFTMVMYWRELLQALGSFAVAAQVLFVVTIAFGAYLLGFGMNQAQRSRCGSWCLFAQWGCHVCGFRSFSGSGSECAGDDPAGSSGSGNRMVALSPLFCLTG